MSKIEMRGAMPRYPEHDVDFVLAALKKQEPCTIADLARSIGVEPRVDGMPSPDYNRVQAALKKASEEGKAVRPGGRGSWRTARAK